MPQITLSLLGGHGTVTAAGPMTPMVGTKRPGTPAPSQSFPMYSLAMLTPPSKLGDGPSSVTTAGGIEGKICRSSRIAWTTSKERSEPTATLVTMTRSLVSVVLRKNGSGSFGSLVRYTVYQPSPIAVNGTRGTSSPNPSNPVRLPFAS